MSENDDYGYDDEVSPSPAKTKDLTPPQTPPSPKGKT